MLGFGGQLLDRKILGCMEGHFGQKMFDPVQLSNEFGKTPEIKNLKLKMWFSYVASRATILVAIAMPEQSILHCIEWHCC